MSRLGTERTLRRPTVLAETGWPKHNKHVVVKVQIAIAGEGAGKNCLIYTQNRDVMSEFPAGQALLKTMNGDIKAFFTAVLKADEEAGPNKYKIQLKARIVPRNW
jgi:hypothetical protein